MADIAHIAALPVVRRRIAAHDDRIGASRPVEDAPRSAGRTGPEGARRGESLPGPVGSDTQRSRREQVDEQPAETVERLIGVYHASGTLWGEVAYWLKARVGAAHCALCDVTHGVFREKEEWRRCRERLSVPFETRHLDDQDAVLARFTEGRTPCVVAVVADGFVLLVGEDELEACHGSPERLVEVILANAARRRLSVA
jgi:hypothetical protein